MVDDAKDMLIAATKYRPPSPTVSHSAAKLSRYTVRCTDDNMRAKAAWSLGKLAESDPDIIMNGCPDSPPTTLNN